MLKFASIYQFSIIHFALQKSHAFFLNYEFCFQFTHFYSNILHIILPKCYTNQNLAAYCMLKFIPIHVINFSMFRFITYFTSINLHKFFYRKFIFKFHYLGLFIIFFSCNKIVHCNKYLAACCKLIFIHIYVKILRQYKYLQVVLL